MVSKDIGELNGSLFNFVTFLIFNTGRFQLQSFLILSILPLSRTQVSEPDFISTFGY